MEWELELETSIVDTSDYQLAIRHIAKTYHKDISENWFLGTIKARDLPHTT